MSDPYPIFGSQDLHDDDGTVIDSLFIEVDNAPKLDMAVEPIAVPAEVEPVEPTRLITGYHVFAATDPAVLILPPDAHRVGLEVRCVSQFATPTFADCVFIADDQSKLSYLGGISTQARPVLNTHGLEIDNHTGGLYAKGGPNIQGPIMLMWTATTK